MASYSLVRPFERPYMALSGHLKGPPFIERRYRLLTAESRTALSGMVAAIQCLVELVIAHRALLDHGIIQTGAAHFVSWVACCLATTELTFRRLPLPQSNTFVPTLTLK